jgi:hypothetical protein
MKCRFGFVSNSSSQSFLIYGKVSTEEEMTNALMNNVSFIRNMLNEKLANASRDLEVKILNRTLKDLDEETNKNADDLDYFELSDLFMEILNKLSLLQTHFSPYDGDVYVGGDPRTMQDDETMYSWKKRIEEELARFGLLGNSEECEWLEECWKDG